MMDIKALVRWCRVNRSARIEVANELSRSMNVLLSLFVDKPDAFRQLMRDYRCVISGSAALWLLDRGATWRPNNLDIYAPCCAWVHVVEYLMDEETATASGDVPPSYNHTGGCDANESAAQDTTPSHAVEYGVLSVTEMHTRRGQIDVIRSVTEAATYPIPFSWTTLLMNVLGPDCILSAYWQPTMDKQGLLPLRRLTEAERTASVKYISRGYNFTLFANEVADRNPGSRLPSHCSLWMRTFTDEGTMKMLFSPQWPPTGNLYLDHGSIVQWRLGGQTSSEWREGDQTDARLVVSCTRSHDNAVMMSVLDGPCLW